MITSLWVRLTGLIKRWTFLITLVAAARMLSTSPWGCGSAIFTGLIRSSSTSAGVFKSGSRKSCLDGSWVPRRGADLVAGRPAATFSARSISCSCRPLSKTGSSPPVFPRGLRRGPRWRRDRVVGLGFNPPGGRNRIPPRRRREKFLSLIINKIFDRCKRFAKCQSRSTSRALRIRRNLAAAVGCPSLALSECSCRY